MVRGIPRGVVRKIDTLPDTDAPPLNTKNLRNENFDPKEGSAVKIKTKKRKPLSDTKRSSTNLIRGITINLPPADSPTRGIQLRAEESR